MQSSANGIFYMLNSKEESEEYSTWLSKLETLDQKRSRVFFPEFKMKYARVKFNPQHMVDMLEIYYLFT